MPLYRFWSSVKNISKIDSDNRISDLKIANACQSEKGSEEVFKDLQLARGSVMILEDTAPEEGAFERLGALMRGG